NTLQTLRYLADRGINDHISNIASQLFKELIIELQVYNLLSGWYIDNSNLSIHTSQKFAQVSNITSFNCSEIKLRSRCDKKKIENTGFISDNLEINGLLENIMHVYSSYFSVEQALF
ncbi:23204_t:CDS:2, partial [Gigaspora margarita]